MFYNDNTCSTGEYNHGKRKDDPHSLDTYMPTSSNSNHPQPQPIQQSSNNGSILFPHDNATCQQSSSSYDPLFSMTGQDTYMDDLYKHLGSWSNQDAATTQQLLASSFEDKQDPNMFFSLGNQQDILLSDPNFVRQQQLLQEQQRATMQREALEQDFMDDADISNTSVMFDDMEDSFGGRGVGMDTVSGSSAPMDIHHHHSDQQQQIHLSYPDTMPTINTSGAVQDATRTMASTKPIKKDNRRSPGMRLKRTSSPIPINASGSAAVAHARSSEIDHQRRQNELQARFRVNYNKKASTGIVGSAPKTSSTQQRSSLNAGAVGAAFGTSVPTIPTTRYDESTGAGSSFPAGTSPLQVGSFGSTSGMMKGGQATSFPSRTMPIQIQRVQRPPNAVPFDAEEHQRQLDDQLEKVDFDDITVSELKDMLRQRGKPATGKKVVLVQRLQEERELIKAVRSGKIQRHSQPPPPSSRPIESARPRSFQASSPMAIHAAVQQQPPQSPMLGGGSSSSVPNSSLMIPGSPNSVTMSLNRMHIGSPPMTAQQQHPRRFSPYATPSSPRLGSSSPKPQNQQPPPSASYSSSVPTNPLSSSPGSFSFGSPLSSSFTNRFPQQQRQIPTTYGRPKSYAPFTSSALATPDRDDDRDPFDDYKDDSSQQHGASSSTAAVPVKMEMDPTIENVLYGANNNALDFDIPEGFTEEDFLSVLAGQGFGNLDMLSNNNDTSGGGYSSNNDMALFDNHVSHATPR